MQTDIISDYALRLLPVLNAVAVPQNDPAAAAAALSAGAGTGAWRWMPRSL